MTLAWQGTTAAPKSAWHRRSPMQPGALDPPRRVLYVVSLFPCLSETFIVREICALIEEGVDVRILSLKRPRDELLQTDAAKLMDRVRPPQALPAALFGTARALLTHPVAVLGAARTIVAGTWRNPLAMLKSLAAFARGLEHLAWLRAFDPEFIHATVDG